VAQGPSKVAQGPLKVAQGRWPKAPWAGPRGGYRYRGFGPGSLLTRPRRGRPSASRSATDEAMRTNRATNKTRPTQIGRPAGTSRQRPAAPPAANRQRPDPSPAPSAPAPVTRSLAPRRRPSGLAAGTACGLCQPAASPPIRGQAGPVALPATNRQRPHQSPAALSPSPATRPPVALPPAVPAASSLGTGTGRQWPYQPPAVSGLTSHRLHWSPAASSVAGSPCHRPLAPAASGQWPYQPPTASGLIGRRSLPSPAPPCRPVALAGDQRAPPVASSLAADDLCRQPPVARRPPAVGGPTRRRLPPSPVTPAASPPGRGQAGQWPHRLPAALLPATPPVAGYLRPVSRAASPPWPGTGGPHRTPASSSPAAPVTSHPCRRQPLPPAALPVAGCPRRQPTRSPVSRRLPAAPAAGDRCRPATLAGDGRPSPAARNHRLVASPVTGSPVAGCPGRLSLPPATLVGDQRPTPVTGYPAPGGPVAGPAPGVAR
jgi:hypothetical protein